MAETDILNPTIRWDAKIQDAIGPDYGWQMLRSSQLAVAKPAGGAPIYRITGNAGHTGTFSWLNRSRLCIQKLKQWAEQHEDGFFTLIDHEANRHYVGNFVGDMPWGPAGNDRYNIQGWQFMETPGAPMLQYPGTNPDDWDNWAVRVFPYDDRGNLRSAVTGNWARAAAVTADDGSSVTPNAIVNSTPGVGDSLTFEYRGYGLRIWANQGTAYGAATVAIDGGAPVALNLAAPEENGSTVVYANAEIPLDIHRAVIVMSAGNAGIVLQGFEVMR